MKDPNNSWWRCWQQSPGACLAFGGLWLGHVIVPVSSSGTILAVSIWFTPDLSAASVVRLFAIASFYFLLPWMACKLTRWLWQQSQVVRARILLGSRLGLV